MSAKPLLYLIDGSSQMYRAFHAPIRTRKARCCETRAGIPTNAVYIFVTMLRKLLKEHEPEFIAASFDLPGRTFRDDLAADYKAQPQRRCPTISPARSRSSIAPAKRSACRSSRRNATKPTM